MAKKKFILYVVSLFIVAEAGAATYYLDAVNGNDNNAGTSSLPWRTIQNAQSIVVGGDTVIVRNGSYGIYSEAELPSRTKWITYRADVGHRPELTAISASKIWSNYNTLLIFDGFVIRPPAGYSTAVYLRNTRFVILLNLDIAGQGVNYVENVSGTREGILVWGSYAPSHITVYNCKLSNSTSGIVADDANNLNIINNDISQFHAQGIYVKAVNVTIRGNDINNFSADAGIGIDGPGNGPVLIENNKVHGCAVNPSDSTHTDLLQVYWGKPISNVTIRGNQFYDTVGAFANISPGKLLGSNFLIENNVFWNTYTQAEPTNLWIDDINGLNFRNNTVIGGLYLTNCANVRMTGNVVSYIKATPTAGLIEEDYNIFNRGSIDQPLTIGNNTAFLNPGYSFDKWNDPAFTALFTDYAGGDFSLSSSYIPMGEKMMSQKYIGIDITILPDILTGKAHIDLPKDAEILHVRYDEYYMRAEFLVRSTEYPELKTGQSIPIALPEIKQSSP